MGIEIGLASIMQMIGAGAAVAGAVNGASANKANKQATQQAQANADATLKKSTEATNKANQKKPDTSAIIDAVMQAGKTGASGTMLTGPTGVDPNALALGKTTLLGA